MVLQGLEATFNGFELGVGTRGSHECLAKVLELFKDVRVELKVDLGRPAVGVIRGS